MFSGGAGEGGAVAPRFVEETTPPPAMLDGDLEGVATAEAFDLVLSMAVVAAQRQAPDVLAFRSTYLPEYLSEGRLLTWEEVPAWIQRQGLPDADVVDGGRGESAADHSTIGQLTYFIHGDARPITAFVLPGTPLATLQSVVSRLTIAVPWTEPQATVFLLADLTPLVTSLRITTKWYMDLENLPRLVLEVDPRVSQRDLAAAYQAARAQVMAEAWPRALSDKHLALALFGRLPEGQDGRLVERMARWNAQYPQWSYTQTTNFARDMTLAGRRLLLRATPPATTRRGRKARRTAHDGRTAQEKEG